MLFLLSIRQQNILKFIIIEYTNTVLPVGSEYIAQNAKLNVSPATVRKELIELESKGYITRPHTSAGSIPLDKGYRYYVENTEKLSVKHSITSDEKNFVIDQLSQASQDLETFVAYSVETLAGLVGNMAIVTIPKYRVPKIQYLQLIPLKGVFVVLVLVLEHNDVRQKLIRLNNVIDSANLQVLSNTLNNYLIGLTLQEIKTKEVLIDNISSEILSDIIDILKEEELAKSYDHKIDGLLNLINQPEFTENSMFRTIVQEIENGTLVRSVLQEISDSTEVVKVIIGQEIRKDDILPLSLVIANYGIPNHVTGSLCAIGPTRMQYRKTIDGVQFMASAMSESMHSTFQI